MIPAEIKQTVRQLLEHHPSLRPSENGHVDKLVRYVASNGEPVAFDIQPGRGSNLWVRQDAVNLHRLNGIESRPYDKSKTSRHGRHSNLDGEPRFKGQDVYAFKVSDPWQAVRVILEVAGDGASS